MKGKIRKTISYQPIIIKWCSKEKRGVRVGIGKEEKEKKKKMGQR